jgi:hypothetical protein
MSEIISILEGITQETSKFSAYARVIRDSCTPGLEGNNEKYDGSAGAKAYNAYYGKNDDITSLGDIQANIEGSNVKEVTASQIKNHIDEQYLTLHDGEIVFDLDYQSASADDLVAVIKDSLSEDDVQDTKDMSDTQEDTTQEETTTKVIDAETLQEEVKQFGDVSENSLEELHEQIGDFKVTSDTFTTSIVDEYDSLDELFNDDDIDSTNVPDEQLEAIAAKDEDDEDEEPTVNELFDTKLELAQSDRSESEFDADNVEKLA